MNLFLLNKNIHECVKNLCDKHVVKMILETAQILYCAWHTRHGLPDDKSLQLYPAYKKTHTNHPVAVWVRFSQEHYKWTCMYGLLLCYEYSFRYKKVHKTQAHLERLWQWGYPEKILPEEPPKKKSKEWIYAKEGIPVTFSYFPLCMDEDSYVKTKTGYDAVESYKKYYKTKKDKFKMEWRYSKCPKWF